MLESGIVSKKNEVNIMMKNVVDVVLGGLTYWAFGYGLSYGNPDPSGNPFVSYGMWFVDSDDSEDWTDRGENTMFHGDTRFPVFNLTF